MSDLGVLADDLNATIVEVENALALVNEGVKLTVFDPEIEGTGVELKKQGTGWKLFYFTAEYETLLVQASREMRLRAIVLLDTLDVRAAIEHEKTRVSNTIKLAHKLVEKFKQMADEDEP